MEKRQTEDQGPGKEKDRGPDQAGGPKLGGEEGHVPVEDLDLFYEVSTSIHAIRDLDEMLRQVMLRIRAVFQVEGASIALHDPEKAEFYFIRTLEEQRDGDAAKMDGMRFPDSLGIAGWVFRENRSLVVPDASRDARFFKGIDLKEDFVTRSMICCPLRSRKGPIGVLYALNKMQGEFSPRDTRLLETLSGTIGIAIENAQLYGEMKRYAGVLEKENQRLKTEVEERFHFEGVIGSAPAMRSLYGLLGKVIETDTTVLVQGETGTGKELVARVIHYNGPRKSKPFVAENCGALSEPLLESELFGHVKGAFTGAIADKKGLFELADKGTVFLDEIGEMSPGMQVKLLRVLQEGYVRPVGASQVREVNVRVIAATNRNLAEEVKKGNFREDLFYRVHVFPVSLPPLRERREDIPLLAAHFLEKYAKRQKRPVPTLTPKALRLLAGYDWPGNVRELENEMERAITLAAADKRIGEEYLSDKINRDTEKPVTFLDLEGTLQEVIERIERKLIQESLQKTGGNRSQTARVLGLTRQGLRNKITRYQIDG